MTLIATLCRAITGQDDLTGPTGRRTVVRGVLACLAAASLAGCATSLGSAPQSTSALSEPKLPAKSGTPQQPVRIAMLLSLSGNGAAAATGKGMKQAGELALFELDNPLVQLIVKDDKGTPAGAAEAATAALSEGAEIIIGPLTAAATAEAAPIARKAGIPLLSFSNDRRAAGNGVYLMSDLPEQEIDRIVGYSAATGKRRFAALVPEDAYGTVVEPALRGAVARTPGATVDIIARYPLEPTAMLAPVRRFIDEIKMRSDGGAPPDALLLAGGPDALDQLSPILTYAGLDPATIKVIGTSTWDFPNAGRNGAMVGGWYAGPDPHGWQDFAQRFSRSFGTAPPKLASLAYDAVSLAITLASYEPGKRYTTANITRATGFQGVAGLTRFSAAGLPERGLAILELQPFGSSVIDAGSSEPSAADTAQVVKQ